jgi:hypothetical protein
MKIGGMSGTHDNLPNIRRAVTAFLERGIAAVLHAGDFCSPFTLAEFKPLLSARGQGICAGYLVDAATVAVVDADDMRVEFMVL